MFAPPNGAVLIQSAKLCRLAGSSVFVHIIQVSWIVYMANTEEPNQNARTCMVVWFFTVRAWGTSRFFLQQATIRAAAWENVLSDICAQRRLKSACASAHSDQSLRCPHKETLHPWLFNAPSEDSDQTARMRRLIWIFAGRTCSKGRFLTSPLIWFSECEVWEQGKRNNFRHLCNQSVIIAYQDMNLIHGHFARYLLTLFHIMWRVQIRS